MDIEFSEPASAEITHLALPQEMAAADAWAIERLGLSEAALMETAARHLAQAVVELCAPAQALWIVCGAGNNGADGLVAARLLAAWGYRPQIVLASPEAKLRPAAAHHLAVARGCGLPVHSASEAQPLPAGRPAVVVDAILGTGSAGPVRGLAGSVLAALASLRAQSPWAVIAADLPSGVCAATGALLGPALRADLTVSFAAAKLGLLLFPAAEYVGRLRVVDLGFPLGVLPRFCGARRLLTSADLQPAFAPRPAQFHKGQAGRVLIVAGSLGMSGAARLAAQGALCAGAGLVKVGTTAALFPHLSAALWEAMAQPLVPELGDEAEAAGALWAAVRGHDAVLLGPGLPADGRLDRWFDAVDALSAADARPGSTPLVIDAQALHSLAEAPQRLRGFGPRIFTPHPGEAARLLGWEIAQIQADRPAAAWAIAQKYDAVVVLKGAHTLVQSPQGELALCVAGNPGMASGGMGDVLGAMIAALLARGLEPFEAAKAAVLWHARAGDGARRVRGESGLLASDLWAQMAEVERAYGRERGGAARGEGRGAEGERR